MRKKCGGVSRGSVVVHKDSCLGAVFGVEAYRLRWLLGGWRDPHSVHWRFVPTSCHVVAPGVVVLIGLR